MAVTISGMFGDGNTYFADSPVVIGISGLEWPTDETTHEPTSPFNIVRVEVIYNNNVVGDVYADTGGQTSATFDISTALRAIWAGYDFSGEVAAANSAVGDNDSHGYSRSMRQYSLRVVTEYLSPDNGGVFTTTEYGPFSGGRCLIGRMTEWERSLITSDSDRDVSHWEHTGVRYGDASTKPSDIPERVGAFSITSWADVQSGLTRSIFYPSSMASGSDDVPGQQEGWTGHAPIVLRDTVPYVDFLFRNRRGAIETCSGQMLEALGIDVDAKQYVNVERPTFAPSRSLTAITEGGRRSWQMSSGLQTREWAAWWTQEFLLSGKWWMRVGTDGNPSNTAAGTFVPVVIEPAKKSVSIYDKTKQQMPHVDFTVTLALEG